MASVENRLETFCRTKGINPIEAMNVLQGAGIVSDNAVVLSDVAEEDFRNAIDYLGIWRNQKLLKTLRV